MKLINKLLASAIAASSLALASHAGAGVVMTGNMTADNAFFAYISRDDATLGTLIGSGDNFGASYALTPTTLAPGLNYLHIEAINYGGPGGFTAVLNFSDGVVVNTGPADLHYWWSAYNSSNSAVTAQPWVATTTPALQETSYSWGDKVGTPYWIWGGDAASSADASNPCQYCTVDLSIGFLVGGAAPEPATWAMMLVGVGAMGAALRSRRRLSVA